MGAEGVEGFVGPGAIEAARSSDRNRSSLLEMLTRPVDSASLAVFRIGLGSIIAWEVWRAFDSGLIQATYNPDDYLFRWWLFEWVRPLPGVFIYFIPFALLGVSAVMLALGLFYRLAAIITCACLTNWFLFDKADYLNHRYLAATLTFLLIFAPANAAFSLDARRKPEVSAESVPAWTLWILRFQVGAPYFFAGIAKLNFDWLIRAEPLRSNLPLHTDVPLIGPIFGSERTAYLFSWGSAAFDCLIVFALLYRRTRVVGFAAALGFHLLNSRLFEIGMFPWMMIVGTTLFLDPDWPGRVGRVLRSGRTLARTAVVTGFAIGFAIGGFLPEEFAIVRALTGGFGVAVLAHYVVPGRVRGQPDAVRPAHPFTLSRRAARLLALWVAVQSLVPLRHFVIPGNVNWTEDGHRFAWRLLLNAKQGRVTFNISEPATGREWQEDLSAHLRPYQIGKLRIPDMVLQFSHYLKDHYRKQGRDVEVRVEAAVTLNGRAAQWFILPTRDLTQVRRPFIPPADWTEPLAPYREE